MTAQTIMNTPIRMPGSTPARNRLPVDTPVAREYSTKGMEGGMTTPRPPATATTPALHCRS